MEQSNVEPGYQYIIGNADEVIFQGTDGLADINNGIAMSFDHSLAAFSMTKTITAIAVLQLAEREELNLIDSVNDWLDTPYPNSITIEQLITHTAGIKNPLPLKWVHLAEEHESFNEKQFLQTLLTKYDSVKSDTGNKYRYSNIGYWLAGEIVEKASGMSYQEFVATNIIQPLDIKPNELSFQMPMSVMSKGYLNRVSALGVIAPMVLDKKILGNKLGKWGEIHPVYLNGAAYGGLFANAEGVFAVLKDLLQEDSKLLSKESKELLFIQRKNAKGELIPMTLGWHVGEENGQRFLFKEGGGAGYHNLMRIYPEAGVASVLMSNRTSFDVHVRLSKLDSRYLNEGITQ